ncbi:MAG: hypothetical protein MI974_22805 [Chitinophagales bacterium]|nr:hypothetical protein [Chitinophagales bacterium]
MYTENENYFSFGKYKYTIIPPTAKIVLPTFRLRYRAKLTDLLSSNLTSYPSLLLLSSNFLSVFRKFIGGKYQIFPINIVGKKGERHEYFIMHFYERPDQYVDFYKTNFVRFFFTENRFEAIHASTYEDYLDVKGLGGAKQTKALYLKESHLLPDFFSAPIPGIFLINEKVASALLKSKITGICLIPFHQGEDFTESLFVKTMRIENPEWEGFKHT